MRLQILGWTLAIELQSDDNQLEREARALREDYRRTREIGDKIRAIKLVRELFLGTADIRGTLRGAKDYIES